MDNDYFGPNANLNQENPSEMSVMGRNHWNRNQWRGNQDDNNRPKSSTVPKSSIKPGPVWMIRKVINARDMDAIDDDVNFSRYARKTSPPPDLQPPPSPPKSKYKPLINQEGKPRPDNHSIFNNINRPYDWIHQSSTFSEVKHFKSKLEFLAGFGTYEPPLPMAKPLKSCLRRPSDRQSTSFIPKQEFQEESPPPPKYAIPGLDLIDRGEPDAFLYGDDANNDGDADVSRTQSRSWDDARFTTRESHKHVSVEKDNGREHESSSSQEEDQARLLDYIKMLALSSQTQPATGDILSEDTRRAVEIARRATVMFKSTKFTSAPAEKPVGPRLRARMSYSTDPYSGSPAYQAKEANSFYPNFVVDNTNLYNEPPSVPSSSPAPNPAVPSEHYHGYRQQPQSVRPPQSNTYTPYQYDQHYFGGNYLSPMHQQQPLPVIIPGLMDMPSVLAQCALPPYPIVQDMLLPRFSGVPTQSFTPFSVASTTNTISKPGWVSSLTPVASVHTANRSNLKELLLQEETCMQQKPSHIDNQSESNSVAIAFKKEELRIPSTPEERKQLQQERLETKKRLDILNNQIMDSRIRQRKLMQKKRGQKDGHMDPQLAKLLATNEVYTKHIDLLKLKMETIDKALKVSENVVHKPSTSSNNLTRPKGSFAQLPLSKQCRYIDNGEHWCKYCHEIFPLVTDLLKHLHNSHLIVIERLAPADRPWATKPIELISASGNLCLVPFQGVEFMLPSQAFYCNLCKEFAGDNFEARNHLEGDKHNYNHSKFCLSNPNFTKRIKSERASSLVKTSSEQKRQNDEALKNTRQSTRSKMASFFRRNHSLATSDYKVSDGSEDEEPASKKRSTSGNAKSIKLNLLKGRWDNSSDLKTSSSKTEERGEDVSFTISTPDSKIPIKLKGNGVTTSMAPMQTTKKTSPMSLKEQKTQRILSNLKKKMRQNHRVQRSESQPLVLEDFVRIVSEGSSPVAYRLQEKDVQTIMAAAKELQIIPNLTPKSVSSPAKLTPAPQVLVEDPSTKNIEPAAKIVVPVAEEITLQIKEKETQSAICNRSMQNSNPLTESSKAHPQRAVCLRGRGHTQVATMSLPVFSVVIKQEPIDQMESWKLTQRNESSSSKQVTLVGMKQEPVDIELADAVASSPKIKYAKSTGEGGGERWRRGSVAKSNTGISSNDASEIDLLEENLDDALLLDDENIFGLPSLMSEDGEESLDDDLLKEPESESKAKEGTFSDISKGSMEVVDEVDTRN